MGLFDFLKKKREDTIDEKIIQALRGSLLRTGHVQDIQDDADEYIKYGYQGNVDVYSIIRRYVTMSTQARLTLMQRNADGTCTEVTGHQLNDFIDMANPDTTMAAFREAYTVYLLSLGNSFWYKNSPDAGLNKGKATQIYTLPANDIEVSSENHSIVDPGMIYKLEGSSVPFEKEEIFHSKYFNPLFYTTPTLYGQSPLQAGSITLSKQNGAEVTQAKQIENQGPAYLVYRDGAADWETMSDSQKAELEKEINGLAKKGKQGSGIVLKDKFGVIKLGITMAEMNLLESTKEGRRILCNIYSMPSILFNDNDSATYSNVVEARKAAWTDALIPHNNRFAQELTQFIISPVPEYAGAGYFYSMDYAGVSELQVNMTDMVAWMRNARLTPNEIREAAGYPRIESPEMNQPVFAQGDILLSEMSFDTDLNKNYGDYR